MELTVNSSPILDKTLELCETIVGQPTFADMNAKRETFMEDTDAQDLYHRVIGLQEALQQKQQAGNMLTEEEIAKFEEQRDALLAHPVAGAFLDAQNDMQAAQQTVIRYVTKTFEIGRVPGEDDFQSCGSGCSCG